MRAYTRKGEWLETYAELESLEIPGKLLRRLMQEQAIKQAGRRLRIRMFPEQETGFDSEWMPLDVVYEDDFCLVVNKPPGLPVHPVREGEGGSLANAVSAYYEATGQAVRVRHIHRLDADTTGPVLYAKNEVAQLILDEQMRLKEVARAYTAVVKGVIPASGTIDLPIGRDRHQARRRRVSPTGDQAITHYQRKEVCADHQASIVSLQLETGRTHQVRVHLSHLGHPIYGDTLYGGPVHPAIQRQALHGSELAFTHPFTQERIAVQIPLPEDMLQLIAALSEKL